MHLPGPAAPGGIETDMTRGHDYGPQNFPIPRMGRPEDIAEAVVFLARRLPTTSPAPFWTSMAALFEKGS
jgi:NAD(P)-dependent dehydrogenase (short-subunit alcohol dehydrogenase family)